MSAVGEKTRGLQRPYTGGTFQLRLDEFRRLIKDMTLPDLQVSPEERRRMISENLRYDQFCESVRSLFGKDIRSQDLKAIYRKVTTNPDVQVDWSELFGYCQPDCPEQETTVGEEVCVFTVSARRRFGDAAGDRKRRDIVVSVRYIPALDNFLVASQKGALSLWTNTLRLQACVDINQTSWVTDCDYMPILRRVATCTERSICLWDIRAKGKNPQVFTIRPIEHSPQCLISVPSTGSSSSPHEDTVMFGDDQGYINLLTVAVKDLTVKMKNTKNERSYTTSYVIDPNNLSQPVKRRRFHNNWVLKLKYFPDLRCFGSCSPSSTQSFCLEEIDRINDDVPIRHVSIPKGVNAFDFCTKANVIATGGVDKVIRVWHPHIFSRPTGKLIGHLFTIVDITCNEKDEHIISLSTARVFRIWDIHTLTALQVFTDNEERPGEKRIYSMLFDNKRDRLLTGSSVLDAWPLTRDVQDTMQVPHTHDRPVVQILYNMELNQMVSVCTESIIKIWEGETGSLLYQITKPHGPNIDVTAMAVDTSGYRLATAAVNGSVKLWDFGSGQEIKSTKPKRIEEESSVIALEYIVIEENRYIITIGCKNRLQIFVDSNDLSNLVLLQDFNDVYCLSREIPLVSSRPVLPQIGETSRDMNELKKVFLFNTHELSTLTSFLPDTLITGCANGALIVWDVHTYKIVRIINVPEDDQSSPLDLSWSYKRSQSEHKHSVTAVKCLVHTVRIPRPVRSKQVDSSPPCESRVGTRSQITSRGTTYSKGAIGSGKGLKIVTVNIERKEEENGDENAQNADKGTAGEDVNNNQELTTVKKNNEEEEEEEKGEAKEETKVETNEVANEETKDETKEKTKEEIKEEAKVEFKENTNDETKAQTNEDTKEQTNEETKEEKEMEKENEKQINGKEEDGEKEQHQDAEDEAPKQEFDVITYDPVIAACYQDGYIRFWNMQGELLREVSAVTRRRELTSVTAICHDQQCNIMITGDKRGYLTLWNIATFLENQHAEQKAADVQQLLCWRAHLTRIVQLVYIDSSNAIVSASTDGSVRVWWGKRGRFVGFYGQHRSFSFPVNEEKAGTPLLPYDITEGPLTPIKTNSAKQKAKSQKKYEYPLMFDNGRWKPFERSAYVPTTTKKQHDSELNEMKFFDALIKPRPYNAHLESFTTGQMNQGAVFRALPVYRVQTPANPKPPTLNNRRLAMDPDVISKPPTVLFGAVLPKGSKADKKGKHSMTVASSPVIT